MGETVGDGGYWRARSGEGIICDIRKRYLVNDTFPFYDGRSVGSHDGIPKINATLIILFLFEWMLPIGKNCKRPHKRLYNNWQNRDFIQPFAFKQPQKLHSSRLNTMDYRWAIVIKTSHSFDFPYFSGMFGLLGIVRLRVDLPRALTRFGRLLYSTQMKEWPEIMRRRPIPPQAGPWYPRYWVASWLLYLI